VNVCQPPHHFTKFGDADPHRIRYIKFNHPPITAENLLRIKHPWTWYNLEYVFDATKGEDQMRSPNRFLGLSIMFFVFAAAFSVIFWSDVSLAAQIAMFVLGLGSGVTFGNWLSRREA
jgi:hypothetical protein